MSQCEYLIQEVKIVLVNNSQKVKKKMFVASWEIRVSLEEIITSFLSYR